LSFGWSRNPNAHIDTDMYVGWVQDDGTVVVLDTFSTNKFQPPADATQDIQAVVGTEVYFTILDIPLIMPP
jgi:hypothetical protein